MADFTYELHDDGVAVVALDEAGARVAMDVAVGDRVLFSKYGGTEVKLDGEDFLIMREDDILGVIQA